MARHQTQQRNFALRVVQRLRAAGHEALWAGGCVRDQLLGLTPKDYDVATSALPDEVRDLFGRRRTMAIGAAFGVITIRGGRLTPIEVATFRTDGEYRDGRRPVSVAFTTAEHDAARRDFTINGLFYDPVAQRVIDYVGGVADLDARLVRAIGDPFKRFAEDKLRMLRAVRFASVYDFALDEATVAAIRSMAHYAATVSAERTGGELRRILVDACRARGAALLADAGLLPPLLPELAHHAAAGDEQWQAALSRLGRLEQPSFPLALAAWFYGIVPPAELRAIGRRLRLPNKEIDRTAWLLERAPEMLDAASLPWPRLQRWLAHEAANELLALAGSMLPTDDPGLLRCAEQLARPTAVWNPPPLVTGDDLVRHGIKAGRHFAQLLDHLRDEQLEGRLGTLDEALDAARVWMQQTSRPPAP